MHCSAFSIMDWNPFIFMTCLWVLWMSQAVVNYDCFMSVVLAWGSCYIEFSEHKDRYYDEIQWKWACNANQQFRNTCSFVHWTLIFWTYKFCVWRSYNYWFLTEDRTCVFIFKARHVCVCASFPMSSEYVGSHVCPYGLLCHNDIMFALHLH